MSESTKIQRTYSYPVRCKAFSTGPLARFWGQQSRFLSSVLLMGLLLAPGSGVASEMFEFIPVPAYGVLTCWKDVDAKNVRDYMEDPMICGIGGNPKTGKIRACKTSIKALYRQGWELLEVDSRGFINHILRKPYSKAEVPE